MFELLRLVLLVVSLVLGGGSHAAPAAPSATTPGAACGIGPDPGFVAAGSPDPDPGFLVPPGASPDPDPGFVVAPPCAAPPKAPPTGGQTGG